MDDVAPTNGFDGVLQRRHAASRSLRELQERQEALREELATTAAQTQSTVAASRALRAATAQARAEARHRPLERALDAFGEPAVMLSPRRREVLVLLAEGLSTRDIAARLHLSPATVRNHVAAVMETLGAHHRLEAVAAARRRGVI